MKAIVTAVILSASLNVLAEPSQGAFDKLRKMFETGSAPASLAVVHGELAKLKSCAGSNKSAPNEINTVGRPVKLTYTKPAFGPNFPSETLTGIALNSTGENYSTTSADFFTNYSENLTSVSLELATTHYYTSHSCYKDDDGLRQCEEYTATAKINPKIRVNGNFLVYESGDTYAYCWK